MVYALRDALPPEILDRYVAFRRDQGWSEAAITARTSQSLQEQLAAHVSTDPTREAKRWQKRNAKRRRGETVDG